MHAHHILNYLSVINFKVLCLLTYRGLRLLTYLVSRHEEKSQRAKSQEQSAYSNTVLLTKNHCVGRCIVIMQNPDVGKELKLFSECNVIKSSKT
jgi:hypothetical protein